jgi:hypothetical protein
MSSAGDLALVAQVKWQGSGAGVESGSGSVARGRAHDVAALVGALGDDELMTAITEHIRDFQPDHLLIALRSAEHADWNERGLIDRVGGTFHVPITVFEIDPEGHLVARDERG